MTHCGDFSKRTRCNMTLQTTVQEQLLPSRLTCPLRESSPRPQRSAPVKPSVRAFHGHLTQTRDFPRNGCQKLHKGHVHHRPVLHGERKRLGFQRQPRSGLCLRNHHLWAHRATSAASGLLLLWPTGHQNIHRGPRSNRFPRTKVHF